MLFHIPLEGIALTMPFGDVYYAQGKAEISRNTGTKFSGDTEKDTNVWL